MEEKLMTVREVSEYLKVTERTVLNYIRAHKIAAVKIGKDWRISKDRLMNWIETGMGSDSVK